MKGSAKFCTTEPSAELRQLICALPEADHLNVYPLNGGRSNQVWRSGRVVVKVYRPESATPLFPNELALEVAALEALAPLGLAPELVARGDGWLAWRHVSGTPWQGGAGIGSLLQRLMQAPVFSGLALRPMGAKAIADHARAFAPAGMPQMPGLIDVVLPKPTLLHGDLVPGNILRTAQGLCLIDWQCPGLGDPVDDLALFLSPAMQWLYRGRPMQPAERSAVVEQVPESLLQRYTLLAPVLHWRIAAHCAYRAARGDADYETALRLELAALQSQ